jgi:SAM-dependent methyltransferase
VSRASSSNDRELVEGCPDRDAAPGRDRYEPESQPTRLNWGCGSHIATGWINSDIKDAPGVDLVADIRRGLPLESNSIDYAVSIHALPELSYPELVPALVELRRTLRPGGALRLVLPDFDRAIGAYRGGEDDFFKVPAAEARSTGGRFVVHVLWFGYTRSLFTGDFVEELLVRAGYERVRACSYLRTSSPFGRIVELDNRPEESLYMEARKPRSTPGRQRLPYNLRVAVEELEILQVTPDPGHGVMGHFRVQRGEGHRVQIVGWALGRDVPVVEVEVVADGSVAGRSSLALDRPDVAEKFPNVAEAATAGFQLELAASGRGESHLEVFAVLKDETREPLGRIVVKSERRGFLGALRRG